MIRIVERYIFGSFLAAFMFAFIILSAALSVGGLGESVHLLGRGMSPLLSLRICVLALPEVLQWSVPLAALVTSLLVFARLSSDGELVAMRACGIGVWTMIRLPVAFGIVCTAIGCWVANSVAPRGHLIRKTLQVEVLSSVGLQALEPGHVYTIAPWLKLSFERKGQSGFYNLAVFERMKDGTGRKLKADYAVCERHGEILDLRLTGVESEASVGGRELVMRAESLRQTINVRQLCRTYEKRFKDYSLGELIAAVGGPSAPVPEIEITRRFALALAPLCFILIGMPLGMRSRQKLSGAVLAGTLAVLFGYFVPIIVASGMEEDQRWLHPEFLPVLPVVLCLALSVWLLRGQR